MKTYKAALVGCSRMGAFIDNEVMGYPWAQVPYSHAAGYEACDRTVLVACSDLRTEVMEQVGKRYGVPKDKQYTDYKEMIDKEQPDIVSVATQPEHRAEIVIYAAEHGARAIYAEKAMAASMAEADAIVEACEKNGVFFNLGTNRRYDTGFDKMKEVIDSGDLGRLKSLIAYSTSALFNGSSHQFDLLMRLNSDQPASSVQASLTGFQRAGLQVGVEDLFEGDRMLEDPIGHGIIQFENDVTAYALNTSRRSDWEAHCENGVVVSMNNGVDWEIRRPGPPDQRGRPARLMTHPFPEYQRSSSTLNLINDLVHSLDTGEPSRCGVRVAHASTELIFAFIESHLRGGARVDIPLRGSKARLQRDRGPRPPKYQPD